MIDSICLYCGKSLRYEDSPISLFYVNDVLCGICRKKLGYYPKKIKMKGLRITGLYPYQNYCRELMIQYKEYLDEALYPAFLYDKIRYLQKKYQRYTLVIMPSSEENMKKRGFQQVKQLFSVLNLPMVDVLKKNRMMEQKKLGYEERKNISDYMTIENPQLIAGKKVLLVDDIMTSGATLMAAYHLVQPLCKQVRGLVICYNKKYLTKSDIFIQEWLI